MERYRTEVAKMAYSIGWDNTERTTFLIKLYEQWTWEDWILAHTEAYAEMATVSHRVDFIACFYNKLPHGNAVPHFKYAGSHQPPNARHTVFVNQAGPMLKVMIDAVDKMMGWTGPSFVPSVEAAREHLAKETT